MKRYTANEAARLLRRNPDLVRRWLREGRLRGESFGGVWMVTQRDVDRFRRAAPEKREGKIVLGPGEYLELGYPEGYFSMRRNEFVRVLKVRGKVARVTRRQPDKVVIDWDQNDVHFLVQGERGSEWVNLQDPDFQPPRKT